MPRTSAGVWLRAPSAEKEIDMKRASDMQKWNKKSKNKYTAKTAVRKANGEKILWVKQ